MKLLIATPAYGGQVTTAYVNSLMESVYGLSQDRIPFATYLLSNESLINRARNRCAAYALEQGFTHLMFIDSDIGWQYSQLKRLIQADKPVIGGSYPNKAYPIHVNINTLDEHKEIFGAGKKNISDFLKLAKLANKQGELAVKHIPTGFMLIQTKVFDWLKPYVERYDNYNSHSNKVEQQYEFFPTRVEDGILQSEDWAFCNLVRNKLKLDIFLNIHCITSHSGSHTFTAWLPHGLLDKSIFTASKNATGYGRTHPDSHER